MEEKGVHPYGIKNKKHGAHGDLYQKRDGEIVIKRKGGKGEGDPTGWNVKDFL